MLGIDFLPCLNLCTSVYIWPSILLLLLPVPWQCLYLSKEELSLQCSFTACIISVSSLSAFLRGRPLFPLKKGEALVRTPTSWELDRGHRHWEGHPQERECGKAQIKVKGQSLCIHHFSAFHSFPPVRSLFFLPSVLKKQQSRQWRLPKRWQHSNH